MDKYEYKVRADEIKELIAEGDYQQAAEIADTIDWRRVKSVMMLCTISDLYKINRRYEDAKNMLLLAYERRPGGKTICYSLCELCIKTEEFVQAVNYYKEFVQVAPKDSGRYILQYKLYEAQDVGLEERIGVLEELKKRDYREKWAYELAYLYHRVGLATRCVEECDELILWFGEGKYVIKAMELKMLHQPLSANQQEKYDHRFDPVRTPAEELPQENPAAAEEPVWEEPGQAVEEQPGWGMPGEILGNQPYGESSQQVGREQVTDTDPTVGATPVMQPIPEISGGIPRGVSGQQENAESYSGWETQGAGVSTDTRTDWVLSTPRPEIPKPEAREDALPPAVQQPAAEELDIQVKTMDVGAYNTINLQAEIAAGLQEVLAEDKAPVDEITRSIIAPMLESDTESLDLPEIDEVDEDDLEPEREIMESSEVFFGETGEISTVQREDETAAAEPAAAEPAAEPAVETMADKVVTPEGMKELYSDDTAKIVMDQLRQENLSRKAEQVLTAQPPRELAGVLSQESDGQISLVVPESEKVEKQITGQMNFEEILDEWEKLKRENEEKRQEEVRQHVLEQTGDMFTEFEASRKDGLLEQLESEPVEPDEFEAAELEPDLEEEEAAGEAADMEAGDTEAEDADAAESEAGFGEDGEAAGEDEDAETAHMEAGDTGAEDADAAEPEAGFGEDGEAAGEDEDADAVEPEAGLGEEEEAAGEDEDTESEDTEVEGIGAQDTEEAELEAGSGEEEEAAGKAADMEAEGAEAEDTEAEDAEAAPEVTDAEESEEMEEQEAEEEEDSETDRREKSKTRALTREEKELYAPFIQSRSGRERLVKAIDSISMAAYTGNVIITGEKGMDTLSLARNMVREIQMTDSNFSGKAAQVSGQGLNSKNVEETLRNLGSGALIIKEASAMEASTVKRLYKMLQKENFGIIVFLEDTKKAMERLLAAYPKLRECFTARLDVEAMSNDSLVAFGRKYAREMEYSIDELGVLALHTRIEERQTLDHAVTVLEVKDIVDEAIRHANRKTLGHFFDILFARRYDEEDMIILTEKDFV